MLNLACATAMFTSQNLSLWIRLGLASHHPKLRQIANTWRYYLRDTHETIHPPHVDEQQTISASHHTRISNVT